MFQSVPQVGLRRRAAGRTPRRLSARNPRLESLEPRQMLAVDPTAPTGLGESDTLSAFAAVEQIQSLGTVDYRRLENLSLVDGTYGRTLTPAHTGTLTLRGTPGQDGALAVIELLDAQGNRLAGSTATSDQGQRLDYEVQAGASYQFRLTGSGTVATLALANLVSLTAEVLTVHGTEGEDSFEFKPGVSEDQHSLTIHDLPYSHAASAVKTVRFIGGEGDDQALIFGSAGKETAEIRPGQATLIGANVRVEVTETRTIRLHSGGGDDEVDLYGSAGTDIFTGTRTYGRLTAEDGAYFSQAWGFSAVRVHGTPGGGDVARLYDSAGKDSFTASATEATYAGKGFANTVLAFHWVRAFSTLGGEDQAVLTDTPGNDDFLASTIHQTGLLGTHELVGDDGQLNTAYTGYLIRVEGLPKITVLSKSSDTDHDEAFLYGSSARERFIGQAKQSLLKDAGGYRALAKCFNAVTAAGRGGNDMAEFLDSAGADVFRQERAWARMSGEDYSVVARFFDAYWASASTDDDAADVAELVATEGDDHLQARGNRALLESPFWKSRALDFEEVELLGRDVERDTLEELALNFQLRKQPISVAV